MAHLPREATTLFGNYCWQMVQYPMSPLGDERARPPRLEVLRWTDGLRPERGLPAEVLQLF